MTVEKIIDNKEKNKLKDLRQQIESLATIMKSATIGNVKPKPVEGVSSPRKKEVLGNSQKEFWGLPKKGKGTLKNLSSAINVTVGVIGGKNVPLQKTYWRELVGAVVSLTPGSPASTPIQTPNKKSMIYKILRHSDLYHNPDTVFRLVGEVNEITVLVEGQEARACIDSGSQFSSLSLAWVKKLNLKPQQLQSMLQIEGLGGLDIPYLGYVETSLGIPKIKAFDTDVLLSIVPDSAHTMCTPITLGTLHIDMVMKLATKKE